MLAHRQPMVSSVRRDAWLEVDLNAIERNIAVIRSWIDPTVKLMAVVKSDAYGHGAAGVADVLSACGADWLGVASVDEGCQLRNSGVRLPILLLGPCPLWAINTALDADLTLTITNADQLNDIETTCQRQGRDANVHLKVDTGMHRLGLDPEHMDEFIAAMQKTTKVHLTGLFSHLAIADQEEFTMQQKARFDSVIEKLKSAGISPSLIHLASGEASRRFPSTHYQMVRVGLYTYGLEPRAVSDVVHPALSVKGRINQIRKIGEGEAVGYNLTWKSQRDTLVASIPIGYADGVDRKLSSRMKGLLMGKEVQQIGLISMDQMLFDISNVPEAQEGDVVTLIGCDPQDGSGAQLHLASWAQLLETITYELACRLRVRMPRVYTRNLSLQAGTKTNIHPKAGN